LATDEKIYLAQVNSLYLGVIHSPNEVGTACNFELHGAYLGGRRSRMGLPTFIQSYFLLPDFSYVDTCFSSTTQFFSEIDDPEAILAWDFGDPDAGEQNVSDALNPTHIFSSPGIYTVTLTATVGEVSTAKSKEVNIVALPDIQLGADTALCEGEILTLDISHLSGTYQWQDGSTASSFTITEPGIYWAEADNGICTARDSIVVSYDMLPSLALGNDTTLCTGDTLLLQAPDNIDTYQWQDGSTAPSLTVEQAGTYSVEVTSGACKVSDAIDVTYRPNPSLDLGPDRTICKDETLLLDASDEYAGSYLWENGATNPERNVNAAGVYRVTIDNLCHTQTFTDAVTIKSMAPKVTDTLLCGAGSATLQAQGEAAMYQWYASATGSDMIHESADGTFVTPSLEATQLFWVSAVDGQCESERVKITVFVDLTSAQVGNDTTIHLGESLPYRLQAVILINGLLPNGSAMMGWPIP
jgi:PKD repeat protein